LFLFVGWWQRPEKEEGRQKIEAGDREKLKQKTGKHVYSRKKKVRKVIRQSTGIPKFSLPSSSRAFSRFKICE
jgi:hypothetical protein